MSLAESLRALAHEFESAHASWPELGHIHVEGTEDASQSDLRNAEFHVFRVEKPTRLIPLACNKARCINVFYGIDDHAKGQCEAFTKFCRLAECAVKLLASAGKLSDPGPPSSTATFVEHSLQSHWAMPLMAYVHRLAHGQRGDSLLHATRSHRFTDGNLPAWVRDHILPPTIFVSVLPFGVFKSVALALRMSAEDTESVKTDTTTARASGGADEEAAIPIETRSQVAIEHDLDFLLRTINTWCSTPKDLRRQPADVSAAYVRGAVASLRRALEEMSRAYEAAGILPRIVYSRLFRLLPEPDGVQWPEGLTDDRYESLLFLMDRIRAPETRPACPTETNSQAIQYFASRSQLNGTSAATNGFTDDTKFITLAEAAKFSALSKSYLSKLCTSGTLSTNGIKGRGRRIEATCLMKFMRLRNDE